MIAMQTTQNRKVPAAAVEHMEDSPFAKALFGSVRWSWLWLLVRLYLGWSWLQPGLDKLQSPAWVGANAGAALTGFINGALAKTVGEHPDVQGWYAAFLQSFVLPNAKVFSYLVAIGETLVGVALILGAFTGIAAFFGILMNFNYLLSGAVSINPILLALGILIVTAWKTAGWFGMDRWLLPALGTPWRPGYVFKGEPGPAAQPQDHLIPSTGALGEVKVYPEDDPDRPR
jgi:thiosulfate dehydrogenase [quinone] large subunit